MEPESGPYGVHSSSWRHMALMDATCAASTCHDTHCQRLAVGPAIAGQSDIMKTSELTDVLLDFYVAKAEGLNPQILHKLNSPAGGLMWSAETMSGILSGMRHKFSEQWELAGPIIQREKISVLFDAAGGHWGCPVVTEKGTTYIKGPTAAIAAMRAYVTAKFGPEVEALGGDRVNNG